MQVIPGIAENLVILVEGDLAPRVNTQREIPLYKKPKKGLKDHVRNIDKNLDRFHNSKSEETVWHNFKIILETGIKKYIPYKF